MSRRATVPSSSEESFHMVPSPSGHFVDLSGHVNDHSVWSKTGSSGGSSKLGLQNLDFANRNNQRDGKQSSSADSGFDDHGFEVLTTTSSQELLGDKWVKLSVLSAKGRAPGSGRLGESRGGALAGQEALGAAAPGDAAKTDREGTKATRDWDVRANPNHRTSLARAWANGLVDRGETEISPQAIGSSKGKGQKWPKGKGRSPQTPAKRRTIGGRVEILHVKEVVTAPRASVPSSSAEVSPRASKRLGKLRSGIEKKKLEDKALVPADEDDDTARAPRTPVFQRTTSRDTIALQKSFRWAIEADLDRGCQSLADAVGVSVRVERNKPLEKMHMLPKSRGGLVYQPDLALSAAGGQDALQEDGALLSPKPKGGAKKNGERKELVLSVMLVDVKKKRRDGRNSTDSPLRA